MPVSAVLSLLRRPALGLLAAVAVGCAPRPPVHVVSPVDALPSRPVSPVVAEARPAAPTGDPALDAFLADLAAAIDRHDWRAVARAVETGAFEDQVALVAPEAASVEQAAAQVLTETLGLSALYEDTGASAPLAGLERIRVITLRETGPPQDGRRIVSGDVRLDDGSAMPFAFQVLASGGRYVVLVPQG